MQKKNEHTLTDTNKTLTWGLVGCGDIARKRVAPALRDIPESNFHAVVRAQSDKAASFAEEFGAETWYSSLDEMLSHDDKIEAVYIATPNHLHAEHTISVAETGKHVLCEKPIGMTAAEGERMRDACRQNGVKLGIAYYRHFYPLVSRSAEIIGEGIIGTPTIAQVDVFELYNPEPGSPRHWFVEKDKAGGGPMFDFGCHRMEVFLNLFGPVDSISSSLWNCRYTDIEVEDTGWTIMQHENGVRSMLTVSRALAEPRDTLDIYGTEGSLHIPVLNGSELRIVASGSEKNENHPPHHNVHQPLIEDFNAAVFHDKNPAIDADSAIAVNRILDTIYSE